MRTSNIVRLDSKGRILIPIHVRKYLGIDDGTELVLIEDGESASIKMLPLIKEKTAELRFRIADAPGSLAHIADILADYKINIIMSESKTLAKNKMAEWDVIADTSECNGSLERMRKEVLQNPDIKDLEIMRM